MKKPTSSAWTNSLSPFILTKSGIGDPCQRPTATTMRMRAMNRASSIASTKKDSTANWTTNNKLQCGDARKSRRELRNAKRADTARAEREYSRSLESIAWHVGEMVTAYPPLEIDALPELMGMLRAYAKALRPWAGVTAKRMLHEVNSRDLDVWRDLAEDMSRQLRHDILTTPVGNTIARLMGEQTELIQSIPLEAAERVQRLTV